MLTLSSAPHPFKAEAHTVPVPHGLSLAQMLEMAQPDPILAHHAVAFIAGELIPRETWGDVYPNAGDLVEIRVLPMGGGGGGGKDTLRTVLQLAVLVAAATIPGLQAFAGLTPLQSSLLQAGITVLGSLAVNALVPVQEPDRAPAGDEIFAIQGFRNQARPFEPVPQVLGRRRIAPDYGARPFTEVVGKDQYVRAIFVWGIGPMEIDISSLKIGETPITEFEGVEMEHRNGTPTDQPRALYSDTVFEDSLQVRLGGIVDGVDETTGANVRVASAPADELSIDITFPGGIIGVGKKTGDAFPLSVPITVEYREVGSSTWLTPTFTAKTFPDDWIDGNEITITGKQQGAVRHGMTWSVPNGTYEVKLERLSKDPGQGNNTDETFWTALRAIEDKDPISSRVPVATTTVRIKATDQLNGTLDQFNGIVTTRGKDFIGGSWLDNQSIRTPAALFRHVLQGNANAVALADDKIDLASLETWRAFCVANNFEYSGAIRTGRSVWEVLSEVAAAGRAAPTNIDGKWGVAIDQPQSVPVSHITPRNSSNFSAEKSFVELPHAFRIPFINEEEDYRQDEIRVYRSGFDNTNATRFEELRIPGATKPEQVERLGQYRMAQGILQNERWSFRQDMEFLTYNRGDRVKITHDVLLVGLHSGRVKSVTVDGSNNVTALEVDEILEMESGESYGITIRTPMNASISRGVTTETGGVTSITLSSPIAAVGGSPAVRRGDLFGFGLFGAETDDAQIISIRPTTNAEADIVAVPYRAAVYGVDGETVTPPPTTVQPIVLVPTPVVRNIVSDIRAVSQDGTGGVKIRTIFDVDPIPTISRFAGAVLEVQQRATDTGEPWVNSAIDERTNGRVVTSGFQEGEELDFRLRWVPPASVDLPGPWTAPQSHTVLGRGAAVGPDITVSAVVREDSFGLPRRPAILVTWTDDIPAGVETLMIEYRLAGVADSVLSEPAVAESEQYVIRDVLPAGDYEVRARYVQGATIEWSAWKPVTTSDTRLSAQDIVDALNDKIDTAFDRHDAALETLNSGAVFDLLNEVRIQDAIGLAQEVTGKAQQVVAFEETGDNAAAIVTEQTARADADTALASSVTALTARVGDNESDITTIQAVKVDASGAVAAVEQTISASYGDLEAMASATAFAEAQADGIAAGYVWRLNGSNVMELVSVSDGTTGSQVTAKIDADYVQITGLTQIDQAVINNLAVDTGFVSNLTVDTLNIAGNAVSFNSTAKRGVTIAGDGTWRFGVSSFVTVPEGETAEILAVASLEQGYPGGAATWGFRISVTDGAGYLLNRDGMSAVNDYPTVSALFEVENTGLGDKNYTVLVEWKGQNSNIELGSNTIINLVATFR